jgi:hypothetical protein
MSGVGGFLLAVLAVLIMSFGGQIGAGFVILGTMISLALLRAIWIARHGERRMLGPPIAFALPSVIVLICLAVAVLLTL